jgi:nitrogen fixation NifU-like protein
MTEQVLGRPLPEALDQAEAFRRLMHGEGEPDEELLGDGIAFKGVARYPVRVKCALLGWMAFKDAAGRVGTGGQGAHGAEDGSPRMEQAREGKG